MAVRSRETASRLLGDMSRKFGTGQKTVKIGFFADATYPDGTSVPMVAAINEFGAPSRGQPPRPFFRRMIAAKSGGWREAMQKNLGATNYDADATLDRVGAGIAGQLQLSIRDLVEPPLKQSTIDAKGFSKPLIDTAVLVNACSWQVSDGPIRRIETQISSPRVKK